jgi:hypothetical protein
MIVVLHAPIVHRNVYRRNRMIQKKIGPLIHMMHGGEKKDCQPAVEAPSTIAYDDIYKIYSSSLANGGRIYLTFRFSCRHQPPLGLSPHAWLHVAGDCRYADRAPEVS